MCYERYHQWDQNHQDVCLGVRFQKSRQCSTKVSLVQQIFWLSAWIGHDYFYRHESRLIRKGGLIRALSSTYGSSGILQLMQGLTFIVFLAISSGEELTAQRVFSSLALLSLLRRIGGAHLIKSIFLTHELKVAIQRIQVCAAVHPLRCFLIMSILAKVLN